MINKSSKYHNCKKNLRNSRYGVSEIIGNLLILAITVTMFSSVLFFVINMPPPQDQTISDFSVQTAVSGTSFYINITHGGGQTLNGSATNIYLFQNDVPTTLSISSSSPSIGSDWNIGEVWSYIVSGYSNSMAVGMTIVDITTNSIVWQATLAGNTANQNAPPIIGERGMTPSPVHDQDKVYFFVTVTVQNSNVDTVWVNALSLGLPDNIALYDYDHDGTFTSADSYTASYGNWSGRTIIFSLNDVVGNSVTGQFIVDVSQNPSLSVASGGNGTSITTPRTTNLNVFPASKSTGFTLFSSSSSPSGLRRLSQPPEVSRIQ